MVELGESFEVFIAANAKVNLSLDILGVKENLHLIDTVIYPVDVFDNVYLRRRPDDKITIRYKDALGFFNDTAVKAAKFFVDKYHTTGVDIYIEKNIPKCAGMGGSSADSVGVINGLFEMFEIPKDPPSEFLCLGSDVPAMLTGGVVRAQGTGEIITKIDNFPKLNIVILVNKYISVDTRDSYRMYDAVGGENANINRFLKTLNFPQNALERGSCQLEPEIYKLKQALIESDFDNVVMTGSGSAVIAYEKNLEDFRIKVKKLNDSKELKQTTIYIC